MKIIPQAWLLLPHALSATAFAAAFAWIWHVGTNRSEPDLILGIAGFVALAVALIVSIAAAAAHLRKGLRHSWPWLLAHAAGLGLALALASRWLGAHIA